MDVERISASVSPVRGERTEPVVETHPICACKRKRITRTFYSA